MHNKILLLLMAAVFIFSRSALAVPVNSDNLKAFVDKSKADPDRVYVLKVGASWCQFCKKESKDISEMLIDPTNPLSKAYWNSVDVDVEPMQSEYLAFVKNFGIPESRAIPYHVFFKGGVPIGNLDEGAKLESVKAFLGDAEKFDPSQKGLQNSVGVPAFPCGPKVVQGKDDFCVYGISGYMSKDDTSTDDFGRANLLAFSGMFKSPKFRALFAPPIEGPSLIKPPSQHGSFFVQSPFLNVYPTLFDSAGASNDLKKLADISGNQVRILMTGHGGPEGMVTGYNTGEQDGYVYQKAELLQAKQFKDSIVAARLKKKDVKAILVQCYGGQYGDAFMPEKGANTACAAFATLPEKTAEGCYSNDYTADREDYLGKAIEFKKCDGMQDSVDLHYKIVNSLKGHDIPMLSSDYFLIYGAAAERMSKEGVGTPPPEGIAKVQLKTGPVVYFDRVNNKPIKAFYKNQQIPLPSYKITNCTKNDSENGPYDHAHSHFFYLQKRAVGEDAQERGDCVPGFVLSWPGKQFKDEEVNLLSSTMYAPAMRKYTAKPDSFFDLKGADLKIDIKGLKPEAKFFLAKVMPYFQEPLADFAFQNKMLTLVKELALVNPKKAQALTDLLGSTFVESKTGKLKIGFSAIELLGAMSRNIGKLEIRQDKVLLAYARLAHLAMSGIAEIELNKAAKTDKAAAEQLAQLNAMKECEKGIL